MAKSERFKSDVAMLVSVYRADGKPEMLRRLQEFSFRLSPAPGGYPAPYIG